MKLKVYERVWLSRQNRPIIQLSLMVLLENCLFQAQQNSLLTSANACIFIHSDFSPDKAQLLTIYNLLCVPLTKHDILVVFIPAAQYGQMKSQKGGHPLLNIQHSQGWQQAMTQPGFVSPRKAACLQHSQHSAPTQLHCSKEPPSTTETRPHSAAPPCCTDQNPLLKPLAE